MPARFTRDDIEAIAALANLELDPAETELFTRQLGDILAYARAIQQVDTTGVPPTAHVVTRHAADRPDATRPSLDRGEAVAAAPDGTADGTFFRVPKVIG